MSKKILNGLFISALFIFILMILLLFLFLMSGNTQEDYKKPLTVVGPDGKIYNFILYNQQNEKNINNN